VDSIKEFLHMGGHGAYIWPAFAVSAATLAILLVASYRGLKTDEKTLAMLQAGQPSRRRSPEQPANEENKE